MLRSPLEFVVVDVGSMVAFGPGGVRRCLDLAFNASDAGDGVSDATMLRRVSGALERVLVAHVTCDPFVSTLPGVHSLLAGVERRGLALIGVASFSTPVAEALARRFGWFRRGMLVAPSVREGQLLWSAGIVAAREHGLAADTGAFLSNDGWEVSSAAARGCVLSLGLAPNGFSGAIEAIDAFGGPPVSACAKTPRAVLKPDDPSRELGSASFELEDAVGRHVRGARGHRVRMVP